MLKDVMQGGNGQIVVDNVPYTVHEHFIHFDLQKHDSAQIQHYIADNVNGQMWFFDSQNYVEIPNHVFLLKGDHNGLGMVVSFPPQQLKYDDSIVQISSSPSQPIEIISRNNGQHNNVSSSSNHDQQIFYQPRREEFVTTAEDFRKMFEKQQKLLEKLLEKNTGDTKTDLQEKAGEIKDEMLVVKNEMISLNTLQGKLNEEDIKKFSEALRTDLTNLETRNSDIMAKLEEMNKHFALIDKKKQDEEQKRLNRAAKRLLDSEKQRVATEKEVAQTNKKEELEKLRAIRDEGTEEKLKGLIKEATKQALEDAKTKSEANDASLYSKYFAPSAYLKNNQIENLIKLNTKKNLQNAYMHYKDGVFDKNIKTADENEKKFKELMSILFRILQLKELKDDQSNKEEKEKISKKVKDSPIYQQLLQDQLITQI